MQANKNSKKPGELEMIISDSVKTTDALTDVMSQFNIRRIFETFNSVKRSGVVVSKVLTILLMMPFYNVASIRALFKSGLSGIEGQKDVYYDIKNNEKINWRTLLYLIVKRFIYLIEHRTELQKPGIKAFIFDDSPVEKTSKKTEGVSVIHDHVTGRFILGYKILVCGYWDGGSFIPIDFSLHREKGRELEKVLHALRKAEQALNDAGEKLKMVAIKKNVKTEKLREWQKIADKSASKTNQYYFKRAEKSQLKAEYELKQAKKELTKKKKQLTNTQRQAKETEYRHPSYGLSKKEKKGQCHKRRERSTSGYGRIKESDTDKIENMLNMLRRAVKRGIKADFVLTDSWFFCYELLYTLHHLAKGQIKLISMAKMGIQKYTLLKNERDYNAKALLKIFERKAQYCKKLKSHYIKIPCLYKGIRVNLFFVRMGRGANWKLLVTTDLNLNFIQLIDIYKIRWSIEVFFKEGKQYLNLGQSLSQNFDAQIADTTLSMIQYIMLCYYKRINYQQSIGYLFKEISSQMIEKNISERLWNFFIELQVIIGDMAGFDVLEIYQELFKRKETAEIIERIFISTYEKDKAA